MRGLNSFTFKRIIKEIHKIKIFVSVPRIATITEAELTLYGDPVDFVNGEPVKASMNKTETIRLPLSKIIDIFHNDYSISILKKEDLTKIINVISDILDRLEVNKTQEDNDVFEYINTFYESILKQNKTKIVNRLTNDKPKVLGLSDSLTTNYADGFNKGNYIDLSDVIVN